MYKMATLSKIKFHSDVVDCFRELPFYNKPDLPFYEQLGVIKTNQAFRGVCNVIQS